MGTALVTGASAGLGKEFAQLFARDKHDVVLVARRKDRLDELAASLTTQFGVRAEVIAVDLGATGAADSIVETLKERGLTIDFLVNNAGLGLAGRFWENASEKEAQMVAVNMTVLVALTRALVPGMVERRRGRVLNIGSTAGFQPGPFMATYYATKAFVGSFTEALAYELRSTGVTATLSCPGATETEFGAASGMGKSRLFQMGGVMRAADVAAEAYHAMHAGRRVVVHGFKNKLSAASAGLTPNAILLPLVGALNQGPDAKKLAGG